MLLKCIKNASVIGPIKIIHEFLWLENSLNTHISVVDGCSTATLVIVKCAARCRKGPDDVNIPEFAPNCGENYLFNLFWDDITLVANVKNA